MAFNFSGGEDESIISETFEAELRNQAHSLLGLSFIKNQKDREAKTTECVQNVLELLDTRSLVSITDNYEELAICLKKILSFYIKENHKPTLCRKM